MSSNNIPISDKQLAANRANAQLAHGATTPEGKKKSSQNARRHGVTAQTTVMTDEDRLNHDDFCNDMIADLAPIGAMETFLASSVAEEAWRLNHARAQSSNVVALGHFDNNGDVDDTDDTGDTEIGAAIASAKSIRDNAKTLGLLSLYEQRIHRAFQKHFEQLQKLQAERKAKRDADLEHARLLSQLAALQHLEYVPSQDGFVFSNEEIARHTERHHRLQLAKAENLTYRKHVNLFYLPRAA